MPAHLRLSQPAVADAVIGAKANKKGRIFEAAIKSSFFFNKFFGDTVQMADVPPLPQGCQH